MKKLFLLSTMAFAMMFFVKAQKTFKIDFEYSDEYTSLNGCCGATGSTAKVVANPYKVGMNKSDSVIQFTRSHLGANWDLLLVHLKDSVDPSLYKYAHIKMWKPRNTPVKFKFEDPGNVGEKLSIRSSDTTPNKWNEYVFDISAFTGKRKTMDVFPDDIDPVGLSKEINI